MARETKDLLARVDLIAQAWEKRRPGKKFSGLTLGQFREASQASRDARQHVKEAEGTLKGAKTGRKLADAKLLDVERRVVLAVRGDDEDGEDSALFGDMGFVPRSQRRRRARRRSGEVKAATPGAMPVPVVAPDGAV